MFRKLLVNPKVTKDVSKRGVLNIKIPANQLFAGIRFALSDSKSIFCSPYGIRTRITTVKGWCPSP